MKLPGWRTLRGQFAAALGALALLLLVAGTIAVHALGVAGERIHALAQERLRNLYDAQELLDDARQVELDALRATASPGGAPGPLDDGSLMRRLDEMDRLTARLAVSDDVSVLDLYQAGQLFRASAQVVARLFRPEPGDGDPEEAKASLQRALLDMQVDARLMTRAAEDQARATADAYRTSADELVGTSRRQALLVAAFLGGTLVLAWALAHFVLGRRLLGRLQVVSNCLRDDTLAGRSDEGAARVPVQGEDEIADMARAVESSIRARRDLVLARATIEEERARLAVVLENTADGILTVRDGRVLHANRAALRLCGLERSEVPVTGRPVRELFTGIDELVVPATYAPAVQTVLRRADGDELPVEVSIGQVEARDGSLSVLVVRDATLHVEMQRHLLAARDAAEAAHAAQRVVFATMSHELRTPLNAVLGYAQLLRAAPALGERERQQVAVIEDSGRHLLALINDALDLAKTEAGRTDLEIGPTSLQELASHVADTLRVKAADAGLAFHCEVAPALAEAVLADERRLRQVLLNLLGNATKFTEHGGVGLTLSLLGRDDAGLRVRFEVSDTGCGLTEDEVARIFRPFEQVGDTRRRGGGTGLGLAISQQLVRLMGGEIRVRSRLGEGTTFWFDLAFPPYASPGREAAGAGRSSTSAA